MARFLGAQVNGGAFQGHRILSAASVTAMHEPRFGGNDACGFRAAAERRFIQLDLAILERYVGTCQMGQDTFAISREGRTLFVDKNGRGKKGELLAESPTTFFLKGDLHIHAEITTDDGHKISVHADGVALPQPGSAVAGLRENVTLFTSSKAYAWVNGLQVWGTGTVDLAEQIVHIKGYSA